MKIGIDARFYGLKHAGLGRYTKNLITELEKIDSENEYLIFLQKDNLEEYQPQKANFKKILLDSHPYSLKSQIYDWWRISKLKLDLVHFTHFSYPVFYKGKFVVTIHDLIKNDFHDKGASTRNWLLYRVKHWGYELVLRRGIKQSVQIITPTKFIKNELIKNYKVSKERIKAIYEGAEDKFSILNFQFSEEKEALKKYNFQKKKYFLYVGNVYPYKNVERLLDLMLSLKEKGLFEGYVLAIICSRSVFYERLMKKIKEMDLNDKVKMLGFVSDRDLAFLYKNAFAYITATLAEGFGITGLEAMASGCPVLASKRSCLPEVYGEAALYFDPDNLNEIIERLEQIKDEVLRKEMMEKGQAQARKYSWQMMVEGILKVYKEVLQNEAGNCT